MSFLTWLGLRRTKSRTVKASAQTRRTCRLHVEQLEDRAVPATFSAATVPELVSAIGAANLTPEADTISLVPANTFTLTTVNNNTYGANGLPAITAGEDLTILGNGDTIERSAAVGTPAFRLFDVAAGATLHLENMTLQGGLASNNGGAIYSAGDLSMRDVVVQHNRAQAGGAAGLSAKGGGIYSAGTLVVEGGVISGNLALGGQGRPGIPSHVVSGVLSPGGPGGDGLGGGLYVSGGAALTGVTITGNTANGGPGGTSPSGRGPSGHGRGGGAYVASAALASLDAFTVAHATDNHPDNIYNVNWPKLNISNVTLSEGNSGTALAVFTVTLSAAGTEPVTVSYATSDVSAAAGSDYVAAAGTLTFAPGETAKTVSITVNGDRISEPDEVFDVRLSNAFGATFADSAAAGIIVNDDAILPRLAINGVSKNEGRSGITLFTFTVTLSAPAAGPVTVNFATADGTATTSDNDYVAQSGTLTFAAGEISKTITIAVKGDKKSEADEYFFVKLSGAVGAWIDIFSSDSEGVGRIMNDD